MAKTSGDQFTKWLNEKLRELNTDESVFGSYIVGILEGDETPDEKSEALEGILSEILDSNIDELIKSILGKWQECHPENGDNTTNTTSRDVKLDEQLAKLLEVQTIQTTVKERQYTDEERLIRQKILEQYSQTEVEDVDAYDDDEDDEDTKAPTGSGLDGIERNTNAHDVAQLAKEKREQARQDSAAKKLKDREDREKQKQMREEKKEKRKTVKGERKR